MIAAEDTAMPFPYCKIIVARARARQAVGCVRFEILNKHGKYNSDAPFAAGVRHIVSGSIGIIYLDGINQCCPRSRPKSRAGTALYNSDATGFDISCEIVSRERK